MVFPAEYLLLPVDYANEDYRYTREKMLALQDTLGAPMTADALRKSVVSPSEYFIDTYRNVGVGSVLQDTSLITHLSGVNFDTVANLDFELKRKKTANDNADVNKSDSD